MFCSKRKYKMLVGIILFSIAFPIEIVKNGNFITIIIWWDKWCAPNTFCENDFSNKMIFSFRSYAVWFSKFRIHPSQATIIHIYSLACLPLPFQNKICVICDRNYLLYSTKRWGNSTKLRDSLISRWRTNNYSIWLDLLRFHCYK